MSSQQPGILPKPPLHARYLEFQARHGEDPAVAVKALTEQPIDETMVIGLGVGLVRRLGGGIEGLRAFPAMTGTGIEVPSTQADLWVWLRGSDRGVIAHAAREITARLASGFQRVRMTDGFMHGESQDLTGYIDGTENPEGDDAVRAAFSGGASFVAVQKWVHDLDHFFSLAETERDHMIGRRISDNEEIDDAPESAHVKRTAQESFEPEAFVLRRSMPWANAHGEGLMFVAFGKSFDAFEAQLTRMTGAEDGIADALFRFSRPVTGSYFWCPPLKNGKLDLSAAGL